MNKPANNIVKRIIIILLIFLIPIIFFLLIEATLLVTGCGYNPNFFIRDKIAGKEVYISNTHFFWRFFPRRIARRSIPLVIPVEKENGCRRIVILGSSAAMGDPDPSFSFSRFLEIMLKEKFPDLKFEIINTSSTTINSNVILETAENCTFIKPDLFIAYAGNNEVIGPYGPSTSINPFVSSLSAIRLRIWLTKTRIGQMVQQMTSSKTSLFNSEWKGMSLFMKHSIPFGDPGLQEVYSHFRSNIEDICRVAEKSGAAVILTTVLTNDKDCPPFLSLHKDGLKDSVLSKWNELYMEAVRLDSLGQYTEATGLFLQASVIDSMYADLQFRLGRCYIKMKNISEAGKCFIKARDYDVLRFRADSRINDIIRDVALNNNSGRIYLTDAWKDATNYCSDGIPGKELLLEHVHLNVSGNYFLAKCLLEKVENSLNIESTSNTPDIDKCLERLAFTPFDNLRIQNEMIQRKIEPPFTNQISNAEDLQLSRKLADELKTRVKNELAAIDSIYIKQISFNSEDWFLHSNYLKFLFEYRKDFEAFRQAKTIYDMMPFDYFNSVNMGITLLNLKHLTEAEQYLKQAVSINPLHPKAYNTLGVVQINQNQPDEALKNFKKAISLNPDQSDVYKNIASVLSIKGMHLEAVDYLLKAFRISKEPDLLNLMGQEFRKAGKEDEAQKCFEQAKVKVKQ